MSKHDLNKFQLGKYKSIVISIALFLLLDASVLILNFYISFEISDDAIGVNIAGRQRMLSQRMVKSLLEIDYAKEDTVAQEKSRNELTTTINLFDATLTAFSSGGRTKDAEGQTIDIPALNSLRSVEAVAQAEEVWRLYKEKLNAVAQATNTESPSTLSDAIQFARVNNLTMLKLMNNITVDLEQVASSKATRLRLIQAGGIFLAIINFFIIMFHFLSKLRENDKKLEKARNETEEILNTVNDGLFLIDKDQRLGSQHSKRVRVLFGNTFVPHTPLDSMLEKIVSRKDLSIAMRFIALLYREDIKSNLISDLNPLKKVEVSIPEPSGKIMTKYLNFGFSRVLDRDNSGDIQDVLVTVTDITETVMLEQELSRTKESSEKQIELMTSILHTNPKILRLFVDSSFEGLSKINGLLKKPAKSDMALRKTLESVFIEIHNFKGEAASIGLDNFSSLAHILEDSIVELRSKRQLEGDDLLSLVVQLEQLLRHTESVETLANKLAQYQVEGTISPVPMDAWRHLYGMTENIARRSNKKVTLVTSGLCEVPLDDKQRSLVNDVAIQCIRNSIAHGVETPKERLEASKPEQARIDIRLARTHDGALELTIRDDGKGFDYDGIREQALKSGRWPEYEIETWDSKKLISLIFESGFSTKEAADEDAGRGMGMGVIKDKINEMRGRIRIESRKDISTTFLIYIPPVLGAAELAA